MFKRLFYTLLAVVAFSSCTQGIIENNAPEGNNQLSSGPSKRLPVAPNFDWKTLEIKKINITEPYSFVFEIRKDGQEVLVAENLAPGTYSFIPASSESEYEIRTNRAEAVHAKTKAASAGSVYYFPSENGWGQMMIEDVFPNLGDLDMNDVIFDFRIRYDLEESAVAGSPFVKAVSVTINPAAAGGKQFRKIGLALNFVRKTNTDAPVKNVNGQNLSAGMFQIDASTGSEDGYVVPLCDDFRSLFIGEKTETDIMNTFKNLPRLSTRSFTVKVDLNEGVRLSEIMPEPDENGNMLDLFVTLGERGREVHVKGHPATGKLSPEFAKYSNYSSAENWVWALILPNRIKYAKELTPIYEAYPYFKDWVLGKINTVDEWTFYAVYDNIYF